MDRGSDVDRRRPPVSVLPDIGGRPRGSGVIYGTDTSPRSASFQPRLFWASSSPPSASLLCFYFFPLHRTSSSSLTSSFFTSPYLSNLPQSLPSHSIHTSRGMFTASARSRLSTSLARPRLSPTNSLLARSAAVCSFPLPFEYPPFSARELTSYS